MMVDEWEKMLTPILSGPISNHGHGEKDLEDFVQERYGLGK